MQWGVIALIFLFFLRVICGRVGRDEPGHHPQVVLGAAPGEARGARWAADRPTAPRRVAAASSTSRWWSRPLTPAAPRPRRRADHRALARGVVCPRRRTSTPRHCTRARLYRRGDQLWVEDLGSTNGTFVNREQIAEAVRLGKGDLLQIGSTVFEVSRATVPRSGSVSDVGRVAQVEPGAPPRPRTAEPRPAAGRRHGRPCRAVRSRARRPVRHRPGLREGADGGRPGEAFSEANAVRHGMRARPTPTCAAWAPR